MKDYTGITGQAYEITATLRTPRNWYKITRGVISTRLRVAGKYEETHTRILIATHA